MTRRLVGLLALATAVALATAIQGGITAQEPRKADAEARKEARRGGTADQNIKQTREQVTKVKPETAPPAPAEKTGEKTRQRLCRLVFDNYTADWIDTFADGTYRGSVPPYGELLTYVIAGPTVAYASAVNGSGTWGPARFNCGTEFWWRLRP
jgi:hypothetical protein